MGSPTKERWKQGVQQQLLTNYYISKYDKFMSRMNEKKMQTTFSERLPHNNPAPQTNKRKNFKQLIRQKKAQRSGVPAFHSPNKANFKIQMQKKNSKQKTEKQNRKNFYMLEDTILNQLYKPSPSLLEKSRQTQIQIMHKVHYDDRRQRVEPFKLTSNFDPNEEQNIEINYIQHSAQNDQLVLEVSYEKIQHERIRSAIKSSFQKRMSPSKSKSRGKDHSRGRQQSRGKQQKLPPKSPQQKGVTKRLESQQSNERQQSYYFESVRPSFQNMMQQQNHFIFKNEDQSSQDFSHQQRMMQASFGDEDKQSVISRNSKRSKQKNIQKSPARRISRKSSLNRSINEQKYSKKHNNVFEDSFHHNVPDIQHEPKISIDGSHEKGSDKQKNSEISEAMHQQNKSLKSSRFHNESELRDKDSLHQFSMISRFSMTSDEGGTIRNQLQKQLGQNQFGPYQNALTSLLELIGQYPHAWPIFVVGQRILDDRHQYQNRRMIQENQISKLQGRILAMRRKNQKRTRVQQNNVTILSLVRQLANKFPQRNN